MMCRAKVCKNLIRYSEIWLVEIIFANILKSYWLEDRNWPIKQREVLTTRTLQRNLILKIFFLATSNGALKINFRENNKTKILEM